MVRGWHHGRIRATRSQRAREILTEFVPELLRVFGGTASPDTAILRFDRFLSTLPAGVQLFSLFHANPGLFSLVADIMAEAPLLAESLAHRPALLDAVLTAEFSSRLPDRDGLAADLGALLAGARDFEDTLDLLRRWTNERRFQVGVQLLRRTIDGNEAGAALADIADAGIAALLPAVAADFARVHGEVPGGAFAIVAMGRLGSREMTLASDLDLILIYDAPDRCSAGSTGPRPLAVSTYYARLSQRLISAMTAPTAEGRLYEVDMRLRPSGESGPIASSLAAFAQYQREQAWTWEHMALTRARPIAGDPALCERAAAAIRTALTRTRDPDRLLARCRRYAAAHRRGPSGAVAVGSAQPAGRPHRSRIHGAIPAAARGAAAAARAAAWRSGRGDRGARSGRRAAAARRARAGRGAEPVAAFARAAGAAVRRRARRRDAGRSGRRMRHWRAAPARLTSPGSKAI